MRLSFFLLLYILSNLNVNSQTIISNIIKPNNVSRGQRIEIDVYLQNLPKYLSNNKGYFYDPEYIELYATFKSPSGITYKVDGFYFEDYINPIATNNNPYLGCNYFTPPVVPSCYANTATNGFAYYTWELNTPLKVANAANWKIRFKPHETGNWVLDIYLKYLDANNNVQIILYPFVEQNKNIIVTPNDNAKGYVKPIIIVSIYKQNQGKKFF